MSVETFISIYLFGFYNFSSLSLCFPFSMRSILNVAFCLLVQMGISFGVDKRLANNHIKHINVYTEIVAINEQNIEMESKDLRI